MPVSKRSIRIQTDNPAIEIHLLDHTFQRVAEGWGYLSAEVAPGLYLCKTKVGPITEQKSIVVEPGDDPLVVEAKLPLATALPIFDLPYSHEYQSGPAGMLSNQVHVDLGGNSQIYLFIREYDNKRYPWSSPGAGLRLKDFDGNLLCDLAIQGVRDDYASFAAANLSVPAGTYVLSSEFPGAGTVEMPIVASAGFQTQVFVLLNEFTLQGERTLRLPDFPNASIQMTPIGRGFVPTLGDWTSESARLAEMARYALATGRSAVNARDLRSILADKFENPMLGILGAHLLLKEKEPDLNLIEQAATNLRSIVPGHPDVEAIWHWMDRSAFVFDLPPMLASSWRIAIEHRAVPEPSPAAALSRTMLGDGPWIMWRPAEMAMASRPLPRAPQPDPVGADMDFTSALPSAVDEPIFAQAAAIVSNNVEMMMEGPAIAVPSEERVELLAKQMRVPKDTAQQAIRQALAANARNKSNAGGDGD